MNPHIDRARRALLAIPEWAVGYMPGPQGRVARTRYWATRLKRLGRNVVFGVGVQIVNPELVSLGDDVWVDDYAILIAGAAAVGRPRVHRRSNPAYRGTEGELTIDQGCHVAPHTLIQAHGGVAIGRDITVAAGSKIYSLSHHYRDLTHPEEVGKVYKFSSRAPAEEQAFVLGPVVLEDFCAVGLNSVVLPGATVRTGAWVSPLSLVIDEIPANTLASGQPAKVVKAIR